jgi:hypothetical protein
MLAHFGRTWRISSVRHVPFRHALGGAPSQHRAALV